MQGSEIAVSHLILLSRPEFRFQLRPAHESFIAPLHAAALESVGHVSPWMAWLHTGYSVADAADWMTSCMQAWRERTSFEFIIIDREDGTVAGACGLNQFSPKDRFCNLGYWVRASKTRLGAATQAVHLLQDFGFAELGLIRIEIVMAEGNQASRGVAEKAGAIYEGRLRNRACVGEKIHDGHMYALFRQISKGL